MKEKVISVCMGSSCFARGNNRSLEIIKTYLSENKLPATLYQIRGNLCQGVCSKGPNIEIDGKLFNGVFPENVQDIMRLNLQTASTDER